MKKGLYRISIRDNGERPSGVYPATFLVASDDNGLWKQKKSVAIANLTSNGNVELEIPLTKDVSFGEESAFWTDFGTPTATVITYEDLSKSFVGPLSGFQIPELDKNNYERLSVSFPNKRGKVKRALIGFGRFSVRNAVPITIGVASGGTSGLVAIGASFVGQKASEAQAKGMRLIMAAQEKRAQALAER